MVGNARRESPDQALIPGSVTGTSLGGSRAVRVRVARGNIPYSLEIILYRNCAGILGPFLLPMRCRLRACCHFDQGGTSAVEMKSGSC